MSEKKTTELLYAQRMILWAIGEKPMTKRELVDAIGVTESCVISNMKRLMERGLVSIVGHVPTTGRHAPIYAAKSKHKKPDPMGAGKTVRTSPTREAVIAAIRFTPMTAVEIAHETGLKYSQVRGFISDTRMKHGTKVVRISSWNLVEGYGPVAVYAVGPAPDAPKIKRTKKERDAAWRDKNRELIRIQQRAWRAEKSQPIVDFGPFGHLLRLTGATGAASKRFIDSRKVEA